MSKFEYVTEIENFKDISPKSVLSMLKEIRTSIGLIDPLFNELPLEKVLEIVKSGTYNVGKPIRTRVDLSSAQGIIRTYRTYSEGGCASCINMGREIIDAQDATSGVYCKVFDPDIDEKAREVKVKYSGFSPKIRKHYSSPCKDWKPYFSQKLEELIKQE